MSLANVFQGFAAGKAADAGLLSGASSGMWPMAIAAAGSGLIQGFLGNRAAGKSADAAEYTARLGRKTDKERIKEQRRQFVASLGYQTAEADRDLARQFGALRFGSQFMAESPAFARNFRREQMANLALQGASPQYMALAGRFMA